MARLQAWARRLKHDTVALWLAARDPRTPLIAKVLAAAVAAYALSPLDLIPDFILVLGYLDDILIVPLGIFFAIRLVPPHLMAEFRQAAEARSERPVSRTAAAVVVALWLVALAVAALWLWGLWSS